MKIYVTKISDWKEDYKLINEEEFNPKIMKKIDVDENTIKKINEAFNSKKKFIAIKSNNTIRTIRKEDFDPRTMKLYFEDDNIVSKKEFNIMDVIKSQKSPGLISKRGDVKTGITYKGKVDEGAISNLLDRGIDGAKNRAEERNKKYGNGFKRSNFNKIKYKKQK